MPVGGAGRRRLPLLDEVAVEVEEATLHVASWQQLRGHVQQGRAAVEESDTFLRRGVGGGVAWHGAQELESRRHSKTYMR